MKKMYPNMHFMYGFCIAVVGMEYVTLETVHRILRETGFLSQVNCRCEQQWGGEGDVLVAVQHIQDVWCGRGTGRESSAPSYPVTFNKLSTLHWEIMSTLCDCVECSQPHLQIMLDTVVTDETQIYPGWHYQHKEFALLGVWKPLQVT